MDLELGDFDRRLLDAVQHGVPLVRRPFRQLAEALSATEGEVIAGVAALSKADGIIREIAGVFDAAALGYAVTLVAARCEADRLGEAGEIVARHPGVSHCYAREGELNLWFTLAVGPDSLLGLDRTVAGLAEQIDAERVLSLPALRRYKLNVRFDFGAGPRADDPGQASPSPAERNPGPDRITDAGSSAPELAAGQVSAIRALQEPLPAVPEPFAGLAAAQGLGVDDLLVHAADFLAAGWLRRYAAALRHRRAGARANLLVAWQVPRERVDRFGVQAAAFRAVSHCYLRRTAESWPYNLYTMIHGRSREAVRQTMESIVAAAGDYPRVELPTTREFKKARVHLFSAEFARWEAELAE